MLIEKESVRDLLALLDGQTIFNSWSLAELGLPVSAIDELATDHVSEPDILGDYYHDESSEPVDSLFGIYGLHALRWIAEHVGADTDCCIALNFHVRADQYKTAILAAIK